MARLKEIMPMRGVSQFVCLQHGRADIEGVRALEMIMIRRATDRPARRDEFVSECSQSIFTGHAVGVEKRAK